MARCWIKNDSKDYIDNVDCYETKPCSDIA